MPIDDLVAAVMRIMQEIAPNRTQAELTRIELRLRDQFGGRAFYVIMNETIASGASVAGDGGARRSTDSLAREMIGSGPLYAAGNWPAG